MAAGSYIHTHTILDIYFLRKDISCYFSWQYPIPINSQIYIKPTMKKNYTSCYQHISHLTKITHTKLMLFFPIKFSNHVFESFYNYCLNVEYSNNTKEGLSNPKIRPGSGIFLTSTLGCFQAPGNSLFTKWKFNNLILILTILS